MTAALVTPGEGAFYVTRRDGAARLAFEYEAEAEAGVSLGDGQRWWGTRIRYRELGTRRWQRTVLLDVHPLDTDAVELALHAYIAKQLGW